MTRTPLSGVGILAVARILLPGCWGGGNDVRQSQSGEMRDRLLLVEREVVDLGTLAAGENGTGIFRFRNTSTNNVFLSRGAESCTCIRSILIPGDRLGPGEYGELHLQLDTEGSRSGQVTGSVAMYVVNTDETYQFRVSALIEGLAHREPYVARARHFQERKFRPLKFAFLTRREQPGLRIAEVSAHEECVAPGGKQRQAPPSAIGAGPPIDGVFVALDELISHEPRYLTAEECWLHEYEVPVILTRFHRAVKGKFALRATQGSQEFVGSIDLMILPGTVEQPLSSPSNQGM